MTIALLLLQLIRIDLSFPPISVTLVISSPCQIVGFALLWLILVCFINCTEWVIVMCVLTSVGRKLLLNIITLQDTGFLDTLTRLVYLIIVPNGLFISKVHCLLITFLSYFTIIVLVKLLMRIHMVSFITVLNGINEQFVTYSLFIYFDSFILFVFVA